MPRRRVGRDNGNPGPKFLTGLTGFTGWRRPNPVEGSWCRRLPFGRFGRKLSDEGPGDFGDFTRIVGDFEVAAEFLVDFDGDRHGLGRNVVCLADGPMWL